MNGINDCRNEYFKRKRKGLRYKNINKKQKQQQQCLLKQISGLALCVCVGGGGVGGDGGVVWRGGKCGGGGVRGVRACVRVYPPAHCLVTKRAVSGIVSSIRPSIVIT